jgi:hypothetical protein
MISWVPRTVIPRSIISVASSISGVQELCWLSSLLVYLFNIFWHILGKLLNILRTSWSRVLCTRQTRLSFCRFDPYGLCTLHIDLMKGCEFDFLYVAIFWNYTCRWALPHMLVIGLLLEQGLAAITVPQVPSPRPPPLIILSLSLLLLTLICF